jgi:hypothetical protein
MVFDFPPMSTTMDVLTATMDTFRVAAACGAVLFAPKARQRKRPNQGDAHDGL